MKCMLTLEAVAWLGGGYSPGLPAPPPPPVAELRRQLPSNPLTGMLQKYRCNSLSESFNYNPYMNTVEKLNTRFPMKKIDIFHLKQQK